MVSANSVTAQITLLHVIFQRLFPFVTPLLLGLAVYFWQYANAGTAKANLIPLTMVSQWLAIACGYIIFTVVRPFRCDPWRDLEALLIGNIGICFLMFILVYFAKMDVSFAFILIGLSAIAGIYVLRPMIVVDCQVKSSTTWKAFFILTTTVFIATIVSMDSLSPMLIREEAVVFKPWSDLFIHAANAMMMTSGEQVALGRFEAAGEPANFYHYGSYMLPALLVDCGLLSGLEAMTSFWTPFSLVLLSLAIFNLGKLLWGENIALVSTATVMLFPDASYQFFKPVYFGFDWLIQASPGSVWGLAIFCLATKQMIEGITTRQLRVCALSLFTATLLLFFRAQFVIVGILFLIVVFLTYSDSIGKYKRVFIGAIFFFTGWYGFELIGPHVSNPTLIGPFGGKDFINFFLSSDYTEPFLGVDTLLIDRGNSPLWFVTAIFLLAISINGAAIIIYGLSLAISKYKKVMPRFALIPCLYLTIYLTQAFLLPVNSGGNIFELQHRPFLISYLLVTLWASGLSISLAKSNLYTISSEGGKHVILITVILGLAVLQLCLPTASKSPGREQLNIEFPRGLYEVSLFMKRESLPEDRFLDSNFDPHEFIIAVSNTRSFLSRQHRRSIEGNPERKGLYFKLHQDAQNILTSADPQELRRNAAGTGIRWIITEPDDSFSWQDEMKAEYTNRGYSLYDLNI